MTLLAASLLMLVSTAASPDTRHAVLFHSDGRFEAISGSALDAPPEATVHHAWVWSSESAPRTLADIQAIAPKPAAK
jgi:hypothetical protein